MNDIKRKVRKAFLLRLHHMWHRDRYKLSPNLRAHTRQQIAQTLQTPPCSFQKEKQILTRVVLQGNNSEGYIAC